MKPKLIILLVVLTLMMSSAIWAQVITRDQFRRNEWQMKVERFEKEKSREQNLGAILDQADYDAKYWELHYDMTDISGQILTGKSVLTNLSNVNGLISIDYNFASGMIVDSVKMNGAAVSFSRPPNILRITLNRAYNTGELFTTTAYYHGHPDPSGFGSFTFGSHNGTPIVSTLSEPEGSRDWWPCKDTPHDKADSADVFITCSSSYTGVSNGVMVENINNGDGTHTYHWDISYPISTYLICMAVTNYQSFDQLYVGLNGESMPITNYAYPELYNQMVEDVNIVPNALSIYAHLFGEYPFFREKFGYTMFPWGGGMEHQDNVFMGYMLYSGYHWYDWITVHEMSHQWFGDAITCDTWPDVWMNEGFASYCEALYAEQLNGFDAYVSYEVNDNSVYDPSGPIYNPGDLFSGNTVYNKGSWVLHMLRGVMGDSAFFQGMRAYFNNPDHQYGTITTREFQHLMEPFYGDSLGWFFDEWVWGMNRPVYRYSWMKQDIGGGRYEVFLNIRQTQTSPAPDVFIMPIKVYPHVNNVDTTITVWDDTRIDDFRFIVNGNPTSFTFDKVPWILRDASSESYTMNIVTTSLPNGIMGVNYRDTIEARGGTPPYHFTLQSGQLPAGLTLTNGGILSGTPTTIQIDTFTVRCTDSSGPAKIDDQVYVVAISTSPVLEILTLSLPNGRKDSSYEEMIHVQGGLLPYHFSVSYGHIPAGLILDAIGGSLSGIPTTAGVDTFTIHCADSSPSPLFDDQQYIVEIAPSGGCVYMPGDIGGNGTVNGVDIVYAVNYFKGNTPPVINCAAYCPLTPNPFYAAGDVNGSCAFNGVDITYFVRYLKLEVPALLYCPDCPPSP